jgi:hypothetical protein
MMDFSTRYSKKNRREDAWSRLLWLCACVLCGLLMHGRALAQQHPAEVQELRVERSEDGLYLSAVLQFTLPELVEDALQKGIPMFFVAQAQVLRERWYWSDREVAAANRYLRLSYQPLTRKWRLSIASTPFNQTGLGVVLGQNFDDLAEALSVMRRFSHWKIADASAIEAGAKHTLRFRFQLDLSQLPRPFQIGAVGHSGWNLQLERSLHFVPEAGP